MSYTNAFFHYIIIEIREYWAIVPLLPRINDRVDLDTIFPLKLH